MGLTTTEALSAEFSRLVIQYLTPQTLDEVNAKNLTEDYNGCCATHDYADANMIMDEAFASLMGKEMDLQNVDEVRLWNEAWTLSRKNKFQIIYLKS